MNNPNEIEEGEIKDEALAKKLKKKDKKNKSPRSSGKKSKKKNVEAYGTQFEEEKPLAQKGSQAPIVGGVNKSNQNNQPVVKFISTTYKTKPCEYFRKGACQKGDECTFSHDLPTKELKELCKFNLTGSCHKEKCAFSHSLENEPCKFYHAATCKDGSSCKFSHQQFEKMGELHKFIQSNEEFLKEMDKNQMKPEMINQFEQYLRNKQLQEEAVQMKKEEYQLLLPNSGSTHFPYNGLPQPGKLPIENYPNPSLIGNNQNLNNVYPPNSFKPGNSAYPLHGGFNQEDRRMNNNHLNKMEFNFHNNMQPTQHSFPYRQQFPNMPMASTGPGMPMPSPGITPGNGMPFQQNMNPPQNFNNQHYNYAPSSSSSTIYQPSYMEENLLNRGPMQTLPTNQSDSRRDYQYNPFNTQGIRSSQSLGPNHDINNKIFHESINQNNQLKPNPRPPQAIIHTNSNTQNLIEKPQHYMSQVNPHQEPNIMIPQQNRNQQRGPDLLNRGINDPRLAKGVTDPSKGNIQLPIPQLKQNLQNPVLPNDIIKSNLPPVGDVKPISIRETESQMNYTGNLPLSKAAVHNKTIAPSFNSIAQTPSFNSIAQTPSFNNIAQQPPGQNAINVMNSIANKPSEFYNPNTKPNSINYTQQIPQTPSTDGSSMNQGPNKHMGPPQTFNTTNSTTGNKKNNNEPAITPTIRTASNQKGNNSINKFSSPVDKKKIISRSQEEAITPPKSGGPFSVSKNSKIIKKRSKINSDGSRKEIDSPMLIEEAVKSDEKIKNTLPNRDLDESEKKLLSYFKKLFTNSQKKASSSSDKNSGIPFEKNKEIKRLLTLPSSKLIIHFEEDNVDLWKMLKLKYSENR